jgi:CRP-like cAMP-binding protein
MSRVRSTRGNLLLANVSSQTLSRLGVEEEHHKTKDVLIAPGETPSFMFFPHGTAVCSIVRTTAAGQMVEAGVVGSEGLLNLHTILAAPAPTGSTAVIQHDGVFSRIEATKVRQLFDEHRAFRDAVLGYASLFLDQVTQNLLCNRLHPIEQRLAKWLLMMRDRVKSDELHLTQEFLAYMLGVHRPGVSIAVSALQREGLIGHRRNRIELLDAKSVVQRSCECYPPLNEKLADFRASLQ